MAGPDFALVGPGRLGLRLAQRLIDCGSNCVAVRGRHPAPLGERTPATAIRDTWDEPSRWPAPAVVFVCVPDHAIASVAEELARRTDLDGVSVLHTSGLLPADALTTVRQCGARVASWHPLQSFLPPALGTTTWEGVACAIEGDPLAVEAGFEIATTIGLRPWRIRAEDKPLYHASAAVAANLTYLLLASARDLLGDVGLPSSGDRHPLEPLLATVVRTAASGAGLTGLTGPLSRGDGETVARHLEVLPPALADAYRALARVVEERRGERDKEGGGA